MDVAAALAFLALAYDADCCTRISMHLARLSLSLGNASANASATSLDMALKEDLSCKRVPVPTAACSLVIPSQMSCCAPTSAWRSVKYSEYLQLIKLPELKRQHCKCHHSTEARAPAKAETALATPETQLEQGGPLCSESEKEIRCHFQQTTVGGRKVLYQIPQTPASEGGYPLVVMLECWNAETESAFVGHAECEKDGEMQPCKYDAHLNKAKVTKELLENGYAVVAPAAATYSSDFGQSLGNFWETNKEGAKWHDKVEPPAISSWREAGEGHDRYMLSALYEEVAKGTWAQFNLRRLHAVGFSSGGFMTSRLAVNPLHEDRRFASLVVVGAGIFYCPMSIFGGCEPPEVSVSSPHLQPTHHAPTLLLHCNEDEFVDSKVSSLYQKQLKANGVTAQFASLDGGSHMTEYKEADSPNTDCGHNWPASSHKWVRYWFDTHTEPPTGRSHSDASGSKEDAMSANDVMLAVGNGTAANASISAAPGSQNVVRKALHVLGEAVATAQRQPTNGFPASAAGPDASVSLVVASNALVPR